jgi:hypothetical protein
MTQTVTLSGPTQAMRGVEHAFQFGPSVELPGITTATHTATGHMAEMIEHLRTLWDDQAEELRRGRLDDGHGATA